MKKFLLLLVSIITLVTVNTIGAEEKPNIVFILADDL